jgi:hypothetical protein
MRVYLNFIGGVLVGSGLTLFFMDKPIGCLIMGFGFAIQVILVFAKFDSDPV